MRTRTTKKKEGEKNGNRSKKQKSGAGPAVIYRVNSTCATNFRKWATTILRDFTLRGYVLDKKRMENGVFLGEDYFERLLEEIRAIIEIGNGARNAEVINHKYGVDNEDE